MKVGGGDHTWAAYLSTSKEDAKDRIGTGPWVNQKGTEIAKDLTALHAGNIKAVDVLDETGKAVPNTGKYPTNVHDILTGTNSNGTKNGNTCNDWTSNNNNDDAQVGHADAETTVNGTDRWNNAGHQSACNADGLHATGGEGRIYCFAKD